MALFVDGFPDEETLETALGDDVIYDNVALKATVEAVSVIIY